MVVTSSSSSADDSNATKQKNISTSALNVLKALKKRHSGHSDPIKSLELLRSSIQSYFDKEVDVVVRKFVTQFFTPAIRNIKDNLGEDVVSDEQLQSICCALLDNAKSQYLSNYLSSPTSSTSRGNTTPEMEVSDSDSSNENSNNGGSLLQQALKRKRTDSENENLAKRQFFLTTQAPLIQPYFQPAPQNLIACSTASSFSTNLTTASNLLTPTISSSKITTKQVVWNIAPSSLTPETLFVLDSNVTSALGVNDFREKLSTITLFRYVVDSEDLLWLIQQKMLSPVQKNGRIYLLILNEVEKYVEQTPEFKNNPNVKVSEMNGFKVPEFMYKKIQKFSSSQFLLSVANPQSQNIIVPAANSVGHGFFTKQSTFPGQQPISFHIIQTGGNRSLGGFSTSGSAAQIQKLIRTNSLSSSHATLTKLLSNQIQNSNNNAANNTAGSNSSETSSGSSANGNNDG